MKKEETLPRLIIHNPFQEPIIPSRTKWSPSSLKLFRKCKRKFFWKQIMRLSPKREAAPLVISNAVHSGLAEWYSGRKISMRKIAARITKEVTKRIEANMSFYDQDEYDELMALLSSITGVLIAYSKIYAKDRMKWKVGKRDVEVWFEANLGPFDFKGKIDLLPLQAGKQLLMDHKIVSRINESYLEKLPLDSQQRGYILGATQDLKRPPKKVIYNLVKKCKLRRKTDETAKEFCERIENDYDTRRDFYFHREVLLFSKSDIAAFEHDLRKTHAEYAWLVNDAYDPLDPREWPCSDHICDEFFRTCSYQPLCLQGLDKGTSKLYTQYNK